MDFSSVFRTHDFQEEKVIPLESPSDETGKRRSAAAFPADRIGCPQHPAVLIDDLHLPYAIRRPDKAVRTYFHFPGKRTVMEENFFRILEQEMDFLLSDMDRRFLPVLFQGGNFSVLLHFHLFNETCPCPFAPSGTNRDTFDS